MKGILSISYPIKLKERYEVYVKFTGLFNSGAVASTIMSALIKCIMFIAFYDRIYTLLNIVTNTKFARLIKMENFTAIILIRLFGNTQNVQTLLKIRISKMLYIYFIYHSARKN